MRSLRGFRVAHVFDISQTEGEPITELDAVRPQLLEGEVRQRSGTRWSRLPEKRASRWCVIAGATRTATAILRRG